MKKLGKITLGLFFAVWLILTHFQSVQAQEKLAQTGMQFLSVIPDARAAALAGAVTTVENYSSALFGNPAMLAERDYSLDIMLTQNQWIADIKHNALSAAFEPAEGIYGVFAVSAMVVDYGEIEGTIIAENELGFIETGLLSPSAYAIGIGYAKALSEKFSVGTQIKFVQQSLGPAAKSLSLDDGSVAMTDNDLSVLAFDFGTVYHTGFRSLAFGMSIQNFSKEVSYVEESFQLPLTFNIGVSMNLAKVLPEDYHNQHFLLTLDAVHPRSHPELLKLGFEYKYLDILALRLGYISNTDEQSVSYGVGVQQFGFVFDYAYTPFGVFDKVQRFTLRFFM
jgi:hypothetical protein